MEVAERQDMGTSNQSFGARGEMFGDRIIAIVILDRMPHHAVTLNIPGNSYRLKEKLKPGLVRSAEDIQLNRVGHLNCHDWGRIALLLTLSEPDQCGRANNRAYSHSACGQPQGV